MTNEDLIFRITRAVYGRLGAGAEEHAVEQLVTEIYREVEPFLRMHVPHHPGNRHPRAETQRCGNVGLLYEHFAVLGAHTLAIHFIRTKRADFPLDRLRHHRLGNGPGLNVRCGRDHRQLNRRRRACGGQNRPGTGRFF